MYCIVNTYRVSLVCIAIRIVSEMSDQYPALLFLYCWQRLISFVSSRKRVKCPLSFRTISLLLKGRAFSCHFYRLSVHATQNIYNFMLNLVNTKLSNYFSVTKLYLGNIIPFYRFMYLWGIDCLLRTFCSVWLFHKWTLYMRSDLFFTCIYYGRDCGSVVEWLKCWTSNLKIAICTSSNHFY